MSTYIDIEGICFVEIAQSLEVNPWLQMQDPLTHFPLKVQSFGHRRSATSDRKEESSDFSSLLSFKREDRFLPTIPPHSFRSKEAADIA